MPAVFKGAGILVTKSGCPCAFPKSGCPCAFPKSGCPCAFQAAGILGSRPGCPGFKV